MTCTCGYSQIAAAAVAGLTPRQREVVTLMAKGFSDPEIGNLLRISVHTVAYHLFNGLRRLGVDNRVQAAVLATKAGLS